MSFELRVPYLEMRQFECLPDLVVVVLLEGVEVDPEGAREEDGVLRDDGQSRAETGEAEMGDVDAINADASPGCLDDPEECKRD